MMRFTVMADAYDRFIPVVYYPNKDGSSVQCGVLEPMRYGDIRDLVQILYTDCMLELRDRNDVVVYEGKSPEEFREALAVLSRSMVA